MKGWYVKIEQATSLQKNFFMATGVMRTYYYIHVVLCTLESLEVLINLLTLKQRAWGKEVLPNLDHTGICCWTGYTFFPSLNLEQGIEITFSLWKRGTGIVWCFDSETGSTFTEIPLFFLIKYSCVTILPMLQSQVCALCYTFSHWFCTFCLEKDHRVIFFVTIRSSTSPWRASEQNKIYSDCTF